MNNSCDMVTVRRMIDLLTNRLDMDAVVVEVARTDPALFVQCAEAVIARQDAAEQARREDD